MKQGSIYSDTYALSLAREKNKRNKSHAVQHITFEMRREFTWSPIGWQYCLCEIGSVGWLACLEILRWFVAWKPHSKSIRPIYKLIWDCQHQWTCVLSQHLHSKWSDEFLKINAWSKNWKNIYNNFRINPIKSNHLRLLHFF